MSTQLELTAFAHNAPQVGRGLVTPKERNSLLTGVSYPFAPGFKEKGGTSEAAARAIAEHAEISRSKCLEALRKRDMTSNELWDELGGGCISALRSRLSELFARCLIFKTKKRRKNANGRMVTVWTVSREATATAIADGSELITSRCLTALRKQEMTSEELAIALGESDLNVKPTLSKLLAKGLVFKTGKRRKNTSGHDAVVWAAVCSGEPHAKDGASRAAHEDAKEISEP